MCAVQKSTLYRGRGGIWKSLRINFHDCSSDSSSDSVSSNESLHEHKSHKQGIKGKLCVPENTVNISNTQYSQVERQREQCSLTELATIAMAINKEKGE